MTSCPACGGKVENTPRAIAHRGAVYVLPQFPARTCTACGRRWIANEDVDRLQQELDDVGARAQATGSAAE